MTSLLDQQRAAQRRAEAKRAAASARRAQLGRATHNRQTGKKLLDISGAPSAMEERFS